MVAYTYGSKIEELKVSNSLSENIYFDLDFLLVLGLPMKQYSVFFFTHTADATFELHLDFRKLFNDVFKLVLVQEQLPLNSSLTSVMNNLT